MLRSAFRTCSDGSSRRGAFNSAFIPLFARALEGDGEAGARRFAEEVLAALAVILVVFTILVVAAAPLFTATIIAPGFLDDPAKFEMTVTLSRIMFPYLACMSLVAMLSGILNALRRYFAAAFAPILLNIILVGVLAVAIARDQDPETVGQMLGWGVLAAGVAQLALLALAVRRSGFTLGPRRPRLSPGVKRLLWLAAPAAIAGGITQINLFIGQIIASTKAGAIAALQYADRIYQLPLGVVGIAIGGVLLPELSRTLRAGHLREGCAHPKPGAGIRAVSDCAGRGGSRRHSGRHCPRHVRARRLRARHDQNGVRGAALLRSRLPAFVLIKVFSPGFFAREGYKDAHVYRRRFPLALNVAFSLLLFPTMAEPGIALATTISGWANALLLLLMLIRRGDWPMDAPTIRRGALILAVSLAMAMALVLGADLLNPAMAPDSGIALQASALLLLITGGALVYFALAHVTGAMDLKGLFRLLRRRPADR
jgi:putative peptidoglycan lipid II flippase